jgi:hypothetical protein
METRCVFFAVRTEFLNIIEMSFDFRGIKSLTNIMYVLIHINFNYSKTYLNYQNQLRFNSAFLLQQRRSVCGVGTPASYRTHTPACPCKCLDVALKYCILQNPRFVILRLHKIASLDKPRSDQFMLPEFWLAESPYDLRKTKLESCNPYRNTVSTCVLCKL